MAGHDLDTIHTGGLHAPRRIAITADDGANHGKLERTRHHVEPLVRHGGRCIRHAEKSSVGFGDLASGMKQLRKQHRIEAMHRLGNASIAGN